MKEQSATLSWEIGSSITHLLHRGGQVADEHLSRTLAFPGLTPRQIAVLAAVARVPNLSQTDLVRITGIDRSTLADIVSRLVQTGMLNRRRAREDARAYNIRLTTMAAAAIEKLDESAIKAEQKLLARFSSQEREQFVEFLQRLIADANNESKRPLLNVENDAVATAHGVTR